MIRQHDGQPLAVEGVPNGVPIPISGSISGGNAAASATGAAVPADADYQGVNVAGTLRGVTGVNPSGSVFAEDINVASIGGNAVTTTVPISGIVVATQSTATSLKTQAETYQGGTAVGAANPLQVSLANTGSNATAVKVDGSASTQPVSGTVATTQSTSPWIVAGGGTAGSAASGVATIQGIASMTPVQVSQATASSLNAQVVGNIAHDSADSGNPVKVGAKALSYGTNPTGVSNNDRTDVYANVAGIPFVLGGHPNVITRRDNYTSAQTDTAIVSVSGGTKIVMVACTVAADAANTAKPAVRVGFGTASTPTAGGTYLSHPGVPAGGGIREAGAVAGADGEDIRITCAAPTGGSLDVVTKYFTIES